MTMLHGSGLFRVLFTSIGLAVIGFVMTTSFLVVNDLFTISRQNPYSFKRFYSTANKPSITSTSNRNPLFYQQYVSADGESSHTHFGESTTQNDFNLFPNDVFDISLVTYAPVRSLNFLSTYCRHWAGPIIVVVYYSQEETEQLKSILSQSSSLTNVRLVPFLIKDGVVPVNTLKNRGIDAVSTTHFLFAEFDLIPSKSLYSILKATPGYLWRDPYFVGVIPAYEWAHKDYDEAVANRMNIDRSPLSVKSVETCLRNYHCRPVQTSTIPMQFRTFSFIHYRNMNCIDRDTELYMVLRKSEFLPRFSESVIDRGFDNIEFVERLRYSSMKFAMLCKEFLFRVPGIGMDSDVLFKRLSDPALRSQYEAIRDEHIRSVEGLNPTTSCDLVEGAMYSWIGFEKYEWMPEQVVNGVVYPKIAVKRGKTVSLIV